MLRSKFQKMFESYAKFANNESHLIEVNVYTSEKGKCFCAITLMDSESALSDVGLDMIKINQKLLSKEEIISLTQLFASAKKWQQPSRTSFVFDIPYVKPVDKHIIQSLLESAGFYPEVIQDPPQWHAYLNKKYAVPGKLIFQAKSKEKAMFAIMKQMTDANKSEVLAHIDTLDHYSGGTSQHEDDYYIFPNIMYSDY